MLFKKKVASLTLMYQHPNNNLNLYRPPLHHQIHLVGYSDVSEYPITVKYSMKIINYFSRL